VVRHTDAITGGAGAVMLRDTTAPIAEDDFWHGVFTHVRGLGEKDLSLALDLADRLDVDLPMGTLALRDLGTGFGVGPGEIALAAGAGAAAGARAGVPGDDDNDDDNDEERS
jgi:3-hydroxyisobutyrate dehydrogenase-like beta-hydroxyacid dehydrogenase